MRGAGMKAAVIASLTVLQALLVIVSLALYMTLDVAFGIGGPALKILFVALSGTFLLASLLGHWWKGWLMDAFYTLAAYWFGLINFLFVGVAIFFVAANVLYSANIYVAPALLAGIPLAALFMVHCYGTWISGRASITRLRVALPNLPAAWRGKHIVFISDIHLGNIRRRKFMEKIVRKINALAPEMVLIGGDLFDGAACDAEVLTAPLRTLHAPRGIYFVTGNHEYLLPRVDEALAAIRAAGVRILNNETVDVDGLVIAGVDNKDAFRAEDFKKIMAGMNVPRSAPSILMKHEPSHLEPARDAGVSLTLSGHTHRGQIFPLNFLTRQIYRGFDYGLKQLGATQVYTSSGVGTWGPPLRLGTKSEIMEIELLRG